MRSLRDGPHRTGSQATWLASLGSVLLAVAASSALSLQGTTYPCPGLVACARVVTFPATQRLLLLGLVGAGLAYAAGVLHARWSGRLVAAGWALAVPAAGLALYWLLTYVGPLDGAASVVPFGAATGATGLLSYATARQRETRSDRAQA